MNESQMLHDQLLPSTQFYFTQAERTIVEPEKSVTASPQRYDILESACESLERNNGRLDFAQLENLSYEDLIPVMDEMAGKLSPKGIYNLCVSMNHMTIEQRIKYFNILCTHLLLPKVPNCILLNIFICSFFPYKSIILHIAVTDNRT